MRYFIGNNFAINELPRNNFQEKRDSKVIDITL